MVKSFAEPARARVAAIAAKFHLDYHEAQLCFDRVPMKSCLLATFLAGYQNPISSPPGLARDEAVLRAKSLHLYAGTESFKRLLAATFATGLFVPASEAQQYLQLLPYVEEPSMQSELRKIWQRVGETHALENGVSFAFRRDQEAIAERVLVHNWFHRILYESGFCFNQNNPNCWKDNERAADYLTRYAYGETGRQSGRFADDLGLFRKLFIHVAKSHAI